jgi:predicted TIM-barrel fold metal-dependent hydrolase
MKIDAYAHIATPKYGEYVLRSLRTKPADPAAAGFVEAIWSPERLPIMFPGDARWRHMDSLGDDYRQVLIMIWPPVEDVADAEASGQLCRLANEELAGLVTAHPERFVGFVAQVSLNNVEQAVRETRYAVTELGALGVQLFTNVLGRPLDAPEFAPIFALMADLDRPIWLHPARRMHVADFAGEDVSRYFLWQSIGWPYETSQAMVRLAFSGLFERHPGLRIITHQGGVIPYLAGRVGNLAPGSFPEYATVASLPNPPLDYLRRFFSDTFHCGNPVGLRACIDFFGIDQILFGTDYGIPQNAERTFADIDALDLNEADRHQIFEGNARRILALD